MPVKLFGTRDAVSKLGRVVVDIVVVVVVDIVVVDVEPEIIFQSIRQTQSCLKTLLESLNEKNFARSLAIFFSAQQFSARLAITL